LRLNGYNKSKHKLEKTAVVGYMPFGAVLSRRITQIDEEQIRGHVDEVVRRSVEETLLEMYLAGVSVRRVEDIIEAL
jgi:hypothetical protein